MTTAIFGVALMSSNCLLRECGVQTRQLDHLRFQQSQANLRRQASLPDSLYRSRRPESSLVRLHCHVLYVPLTNEVLSYVSAQNRGSSCFTRQVPILPDPSISWVFKVANLHSVRNFTSSASYRLSSGTRAGSSESQASFFFHNFLMHHPINL